MVPGLSCVCHDVHKLRIVLVLDRNKNNLYQGGATVDRNPARLPVLNMIVANMQLTVSIAHLFSKVQSTTSVQDKAPPPRVIVQTNVVSYVNVYSIYCHMHGILLQHCINYWSAQFVEVPNYQFAATGYINIQSKSTQISSFQHFISCTFSLDQLVRKVRPEEVKLSPIYSALKDKLSVCLCKLNSDVMKK